MLLFIEMYDMYCIESVVNLNFSIRNIKYLYVCKLRMDLRICV